MPGTREVMDELRARGIKVTIVSAGVDLFVASIASMLDVDDWMPMDSNSMMRAGCSRTASADCVLQERATQSNGS